MYNYGSVRGAPSGRCLFLGPCGHHALALSSDQVARLHELRGFLGHARELAPSRPLCLHIGHLVSRPLPISIFPCLQHLGSICDRGRVLASQLTAVSNTFMVSAFRPIRKEVQVHVTWRYIYLDSSCCSGVISVHTAAGWAYCRRAPAGRTPRAW